MSRSHARVRRSALTPLAAAATALAAGLVLLNGTPGSFAFLNDTTTQPPKSVTAGGLTLSITQSSEWVSTSSGSTGSVIPAGSAGYVPGQRGQKLTFTLANASTSATPATLASTLSAGTFWADLAAKNLLSITPTVLSGPCSVGALTTTPEAISLPVSSTTALPPGGSCVLAFTVAIPTNSASTDAATYLRKSMKTTVGAFAMDGTLTQAGR
jgi:alternate signal-mediated exported protein